MTKFRLEPGFRWLEAQTEKTRAANFARFLNGPTVTRVTEGDPPSEGIEIDFESMQGNPAQTVQVSDVPFGVRVYDCLYARHPFGASASGATIANQIYAFRFRLDSARTIDEYWFRYSSGGGTKNFKLGLYASTSDLNRYPAAKLSEVGAAGTGLGYQIAENLSLDPGWYWQVLLHDVTNAVMTVPVGALWHTGTGWSSVAGPTMIAGLKIAHAFGALPDPFPAGALLLTAADVFPFIGTHFSA